LVFPWFGGAPATGLVPQWLLLLKDGTLADYVPSTGEFYSRIGGASTKGAAYERGGRLFDGELLRFLIVRVVSIDWGLGRMDFLWWKTRGWPSMGFSMSVFEL
jgi:hypothetical protein